MNTFVWPEPITDFSPVVLDPGPASDSLYFVSHKGRILMTPDEYGKWRPVTADALEVFSVEQEHFMGCLGNKGCYALEVIDPGTYEFANLRSGLEEFDNLMLNLAGRALQICDWFRTHQYCGNCGERTTLHELDRAMVCSQCRLHFYPRLSPSIIVLVHRDDQVLLGRNHLFPADLFSTFAGFVEPGESVEEAVRREVYEEVGVRVGQISYRGSQPWPFPNSLMLGFHAEYHSGDVCLQEDEIAEAYWYSLDKLPRIPGKFAISRWLIDDYMTHSGFAT